MRNIMKNNVYPMKFNIYVANTYLLWESLIKDNSVVFLRYCMDKHINGATSPFTCRKHISAPLFSSDPPSLVDPSILTLL